MSEDGYWYNATKFSFESKHAKYMLTRAAYLLGAALDDEDIGVYEGRWWFKEAKMLLIHYPRKVQTMQADLFIDHLACDDTNCVHNDPFGAEATRYLD